MVARSGFSVVGVAFGRCVSHDCWCLTGLQPRELAQVVQWLKSLGCRVSSFGSCVASHRGWVAFRCERSLASQLAAGLPIAPGSRGFRFRS